MPSALQFVLDTGTAVSGDRRADNPGSDWAELRAGFEPGCEPGASSLNHLPRGSMARGVLTSCMLLAAGAALGVLTRCTVLADGAALGVAALGVVTRCTALAD